ncbi:zinc finger CCCH domain-containing protein 37-like isoform X2 [Chenopodium quinoa]|uniref:zinc finger CCCH domain-containing protein 37-like isoform X2 n=1 Tax=Chenopodium quinoa TaxID=63459 RepID=UPI000B7824E7|nr:zinc finger CCCH domain-containing protein 37-like isoform X2 [Chenopodium quinoa]
MHTIQNNNNHLPFEPLLATSSTLTLSPVTLLPLSIELLLPILILFATPPLTATLSPPLTTLDSPLLLPECTFLLLLPPLCGLLSTLLLLSVSALLKPASVPSSDSLPERPGEPDCPYFLKTQKCKFGQMCKFNHPKDKLDSSSCKTDDPDLPDRPSEPVCSFYMKMGKCKFGTSCKFHHPKDIKVPSNKQEAGDGVQTHSIDQNGSDGTAGDGNIIKPTSNAALSYNSKGLPMRPDEVDCPFYMKTGSCKYGITCRYNHPDRNELLSPYSVINPTAAMVGHTVFPSLANFNVGFVNPAASIFQSLQPGLAQTMYGPVPMMYPQRPGQIECDFYMKTGECKFGEKCRFHHPIDRSAPTRNQTLEQNVKFTLAGLPRREGVEHCPFYMKTGTCSYGANCKFDHPPPGEVMAVAGQETSTKAEEEETEDGENVATAE